LFLSSGNKASHLAAIAVAPRGMLVAVEADAVRERLLRATMRRQLCFNVRVVGKDMLMCIWIYGYMDIWKGLVASSS
jgi:16S rRNA C967 or C1407 C5-methylase (RsmB/RsmF family)